MLKLCQVTTTSGINSYESGDSLSCGVQDLVYRVGHQRKAHVVQVLAGSRVCEQEVSERFGEGPSAHEEGA